MNGRALVSLLKRTVAEWIDDEAPSRAASLSYYTVFSLAPLLLISVAIAGLVFGHEAVSGELARQLQGLLGTGGAQAIQEMMASASRTGSGVAAVVGIVLLVLGSTGAFVELQDSLSAIWDVDKKKTNGLWAFFRARLLSFAMVGVISFLLLVSLVVSAGLSALGHFAEDRLPASELVFQIVSFGVSFAVITVLFAAIFKVLPDAKVAWGDVWLGAAATSLLFVIGKLLIGLYIGKASVASSYGAAGSFAVLLIWVNYSGMILFFGAEFTQVYSRSHEAQRPGSSAAAGGQAFGRSPAEELGKTRAGISVARVEADGARR
jgi:membrane protein